MRGKNAKGMVMLLVSLVPALVSAGPTVGDHARDTIASALSSGSPPNPRYRREISCITGLSNSHIATVAAEFHKPPVRFTGLPAPATGVKSLPPVPGTLLMVLVGFVCVSLVKDRRAWLAALAGLLCATQAGFSLLPQLALHLAGKRQGEQQSSALCAARSCEPRHPCRLRSDIEGTYYIGLLCHLAGIPDGTISFSFPVPPPSLPAQKAHATGLDQSQGNLNAPGYRPVSALPKHRFRAPESAMTRLSSFLLHTASCLAPDTSQSVDFLTALIIVKLARGPPDLV